MSTWGVTLSDVFNTTAVSAAASDLASADSIVTIYVNRTPSASGAISPRDLATIATAIQWQTAWMSQNPNVFQRNQFESLTGDGQSVTQAAEWAHVLSPIAARAIRNLSWKGSRTLRTPSVRVNRVNAAAQFELEASDIYSDWQPLP